MLFSSQVFILVFLPTVLCLYYIAAEHRPSRQVLIILASLVFYAWWDIRFVPLLVGLTFANWAIAGAYGRRYARWIPTAGIVLNLAVLVLFKYLNFLLVTAAELVGLAPPSFSIILPLGISFFVFQKIAYLVDLRRGDRHIYGLRDFFMFVTFFPQLIAGPLVRHHEIIPQFAADPRRVEMWENLSRGFLLFLIGLLKKAALADTAALVADRLFLKATGFPLSAAEAWAAAGSYALQIYFDFSGYSDMAIGLALMFGLRLPINFDAPYRATSIRDFWRRWHITLSRFLRDYLYVPLGGNRSGAARQAANVVFTMLLGGLWHGASWTFVAWGGLHGLALAGNAAWRRRFRPLPAVLGWALTLLFVVTTWVLFRADFATAARVLAAMAGWNGRGRVHVDNALVLLIGVAVALLGPTSQVWVARTRPSLWLGAGAGLALAFALLLIGGRLPSEFIYFQF